MPSPRSIARRGAWELALAHAQSSLRANADNGNVRNLIVLILQKLGRLEEASQMLRETRQLDPLDFWSLEIAGADFSVDNQLRLDIAFDYTRAGFFERAAAVLKEADDSAQDGSVPMVFYALATIHLQLGDQTGRTRLAPPRQGLRIPVIVFRTVPGGNAGAGVCHRP